MQENIMKTLICAITLCTTAYMSVAQAMPPQGPPPPEMLAAYLQLNEEQQVKLRDIMEKQKTRHDQLRSEFRENLGEILTPEQMQRFEQLGEKRRSGGDCAGNKMSRGDFRPGTHLTLSAPDRRY
jgi:Spy/CpxP family protein refolding chaperone